MPRGHGGAADGRRACSRRPCCSRCCSTRCILAQIGLLISRAPSYVADIRDWAGEVIATLQERLGSDYVDEKLRDLVAGQAGSMLGFIAAALSRIVGSGFALFNVLSLVVVTPVVAFYLLRDWRRAVARIDSWLPRRYAGVLRAQAREVDRILSAWLRGQAICCVLLAGFYAVSLTVVGLDLGLIVGLAAGLLSFIPYVGSITGGVDQPSASRSRSSTGRAWRWWPACSCSARSSRAT